MVPVNVKTGAVDAAAVVAAAAAGGEDCCLVTIMAANNETGVLQVEFMCMFLLFFYNACSMLQPLAEIGEGISALNAERAKEGGFR